MITEPQQIGEELKKYLTDIERPSQDNLPDYSFRETPNFKLMSNQRTLTP